MPTELSTAVREWCIVRLRPERDAEPGGTGARAPVKEASVDV
jgi:hypothetical protein